MPVEGTALPLWGLEIDPDRARDDFRAFNARDDGKVSIHHAGQHAMHKTRPATSAQLMSLLVRCFRASDLP